MTAKGSLVYWRNLIFSVASVSSVAKIKLFSVCSVPSVAKIKLFSVCSVPSVAEIKLFSVCSVPSVAKRNHALWPKIKTQAIHFNME